MNSNTPNRHPGRPAMIAVELRICHENIARWESDHAFALAAGNVAQRRVATRRINYDKRSIARLEAELVAAAWELPR